LQWEDRLGITRYQGGVASGVYGLQADKIRIATRGSPLALAQAREVRSRLMAAHGLAEDAFEIKVIKTSGDSIQDRPLSEAGGKGLFTKEIEEALLSGKADLAVHSMKDVETVLPLGLSIAAVLPREDVRDAFISVRYKSLADLPSGARIGTSSLRRRAQVLRLRPDLKPVDFRGNVETRLKKLEQGVADATFLALAGLNRLGQSQRATAVMPAEEMLPAVAQGAIGIQIRHSDVSAAKLVAPLNHEPTALCIAAERAFLAKLDGSCRTPIAGLAQLKGAEINFRGMILSTGGRRCLMAHRQGPAAQALILAEDAAAELLDQAGPNFFQETT
jgi:hydroxymethylbilane synthase